MFEAINSYENHAGKLFQIKATFNKYALKPKLLLLISHKSTTIALSRLCVCFTGLVASHLHTIHPYFHHIQELDLSSMVDFEIL